MGDTAVLIGTGLFLGLGLAMDAFSVSLANGLAEPRMKIVRMCGVAGIFSVFQALMPLIGWICVHTMAQKFEAFAPLIPWIALALLGYIGGKMLWEGIRCHSGAGECRVGGATLTALLVQGLATSIDALTVGFTIANYTFLPALLCTLIIGIVTFLVCFVGIELGKRFGLALSGKASIFGGAILIVIGLVIFFRGIFL
ncbi:MAG: manganese efflux pump [Ruminococcaceae bacterium]|nr:manganese efflux pump [Oscillospiraceae bacterium]